MRELIIGKNDAGQRLDKFITKTLDLPMSLLYKSIRLKKIKVNRKRAENNTILCEGDTIQCFLAEEFFEKKVNESSFENISVKAEGDFTTRFEGSANFGNADNAQIKLDMNIAVNKDGNTFVPFDSVKDAK